MGLKQAYKQQGFVHVSGLLNSDEVRHYRETFLRISGLEGKAVDFKDPTHTGWSMNDAVTHLPECWPLIFNPKLLKTVREILGNDIRYTQHSDLHVNFGVCGWHRDSACRRFGEGSDWDQNLGDYSVVRIAIYLQSFEESQFSLGVVPGSHLQESLATTLEMKAWGVVGRFFDRTTFVAPLITVKPKWLKVNAGDCVIFNQRLFHSGSPIRGPKFSVYFSYGLDNEHSRNHMKYYYHTRKELKYKSPPPELTAQLKKENLLLELGEGA